ncbi:hypothetical protein [Nocardiopsis quinghaiensis]|uniref:hypothetical protein n=1 Tax=Nocardiopsis quinghaiensis TaxID=464995 RepID=UPI001681453B|nr:hypothetical protein [Nocardiopsis quinghaiensis]
MNAVRQRASEWTALAAAAGGVLLACFTAVGTLVADNVLIPVTTSAAGAPLVGDGGGPALTGPVTAALEIAEPTVGDRLWAFAPSLVLAVQVAVVGLLLFRVVRSLRTGAPFAPVNVRRLWACAAVVLAGALLASATRVFAYQAVVDGASRALPGSPPLEVVVDVPVTAVALGLGLAAAAEFMRRGTVLREDVDGLV